MRCFFPKTCQIKGVTLIFLQISLRNALFLPQNPSNKEGKLTFSLDLPTEKILHHRRCYGTVHSVGLPRVTKDEPRFTQDDPWVIQDDPRVAQDDPKVGQYDPRVTLGDT